MHRPSDAEILENPAAALNCSSSTAVDILRIVALRSGQHGEKMQLGKTKTAMLLAKHPFGILRQTCVLSLSSLSPSNYDMFFFPFFLPLKDTLMITIEEVPNYAAAAIYHRDFVTKRCH